MPPDERLRASVDHLARLLGDERGPSVLAELQKLMLRASAGGSAPDPVGDDQCVGVWRVERDSAGTGLRRSHDIDPASWVDWADVDYVPPAGGARRVVLVGESAARGWPYDPALSCARVLQRNLDAAKPGGYQCVDLAKTGAKATDVDAIIDRLPALAPDTVVAFVGNNWTFGHDEIRPHSPDLEQIERHDVIADALGTAGYVGMRDALAALTRERARGFLDRLVGLAAGGVEVVVVVPEFNLCGWVPPEQVCVPVLGAGALVRWFGLWDEAVRCGERGWWVGVAPLAAGMRELDGGMSPVPGYLAGVAARALGDGVAARVELEDSRDAVCGLLVRYPPRVTAATQHLLASWAADRGWGCVDLRSVLADGVGLPDEGLFHDYCHLSDRGIEVAMAAVCDVVVGVRVGTTVAGLGLGASGRAFGHAHAAAHLAYTGQPASVVGARLAAAVAADAGVVPTLVAVRDLLSAPRPAWTAPAAHALTRDDQIRAFALATASMRALPPWAWLLRECLGQVVGPEHTGDCTPVMDLLAGPDGATQALPNWLAARGHHLATGRSTSLPFALDRPRGSVLELTYRTPATPETDPAVDGVEVMFNTTVIATLATSRGWREQRLALPAHAAVAGVNRVELRWPVPAPDLDAHITADAAALSRGELPFVLPIFGELFTARVLLEGERP